MRDHHAELEALGVQILGVSFDTQEANKAFKDKLSFRYRLLCDTERVVGLAYGAASSREDAAARRMSYVIDERGRIAFAYPKVKAAEHLQLVLHDLESIGSA